MIASLNRSKKNRQCFVPPFEGDCISWTQHHRIIPRGRVAAARAGKWRVANAPYVEGVMRLACAPGVAQLNVKKAAQIGISETMRCLMAYWMATSPDPIALVLPNRDKGRKIVRQHVMPMLSETKPIAALMTGRKADTSAEIIRLLNGSTLHLMWAGSATSLSSEPIRRAMCDEVDKFDDWGSHEADPIASVASRLRSYSDTAIQVNVSTPTTHFGAIHKLWKSSEIQLDCVCACPACSKMICFADFGQLKWKIKPIDEKESTTEKPERRLRQGDVWIQCPECDHHITTDERNAAMGHCVWRQRGGGIEDALAVKVWPTGTRIGMHINALQCLWISLETIASEYILSKRSRSLQYSFDTEMLGMVHEPIVSQTKPTLFIDKINKDAKEGEVPAWAGVLIAAIDVQKDHFYAVVRAWGHGMRSRRVWHGKLVSFDELDAICWKRPWTIEGGGSAICDLSLIDTGGGIAEGDQATRTMQVYKWALTRKASIRPIKGAGRPKSGAFIWPGRGFLTADHRRVHKSADLRIWWLDSNHFHDELTDMMHTDAWELNDRDDPEYIAHMVGAVKRVERSGSRIRESWGLRRPGDRMDYRDCEAYSVAGAYMARAHLLPEEYTIAKAQQALAAAAPTRSTPQSKPHGDAWRPSL